MPKCHCSNCDPASSTQLIENLIWANKSNFDLIVNGEFTPGEVYNVKHKYPQKSCAFKKRKFTEADNLEISNFSNRLVGDLHQHYDSVVSPGGTIQSSDLFDEVDAKAVIACLDHIYSAKDLRCVIGGYSFQGQCNWIIRYKSSASIFSEGLSDFITPPQKRPKPTNPHPSNVIGLGPPPRPPTKKALVAEAARIRSMERKKEKERKELLDLKRKEQEAKESHLIQGKHYLTLWMYNLR
jgi:hypothetical protein